MSSKTGYKLQLKIISTQTVPCQFVGKQADVSFLESQ